MGVVSLCTENSLKTEAVSLVPPGIQVARVQPCRQEVGQLFSG